MARIIIKLGLKSTRMGLLVGNVDQIHIRLRACRRPSIFSPAESAPPPNVRDALFSLLQGPDPLDPKAPQGPHPHPNPPKGPKGTQRAQGEGGQGNPRGHEGPKGTKGTRGSQGDPRAPSAPLGGMGPWGPLELFRSHSEWKIISSERQLREGKPFRTESHSVRKQSERKAS